MLYLTITCTANACSKIDFTILNNKIRLFVKYFSKATLRLGGVDHLGRDPRSPWSSSIFGTEVKLPWQDIISGIFTWIRLPADVWIVQTHFVGPPWYFDGKSGNTKYFGSFGEAFQRFYNRMVLLKNWYRVVLRLKSVPDRPHGHMKLSLSVPWHL